MATLATEIAYIQPESLSASAKVLDHHTEPASETVHHGDEDHHEHSITHQMMILVLQLAFILLSAKFVGEIFERYLRQPAVLGELSAGMLIGPFALGPYLVLPGVGALFPKLETVLPVSPELYGIATVASIVLLFLVGLETDFKKFLKYAGPGAAVGIGGVLFSFLSGAYLYVLFTGEPFMSPAALFMGTVSTATSVGITARVLSEKSKLDSAEGTTILAGAVIDDVLGILILAIVGGIAVASQTGNGEVDWGAIGMIAVKAVGFWLIATACGILFSSRIAKGVEWFRSPGGSIAMGFGLALLLAGVAEMFGLAMIIGAYIMGLSLSRETLSHFLEDALASVYACLVPIFFAVMGMLVDFQAMLQAIGFGLIYALVAVVSKILGGGLPCLFVGFNAIGALRVGLGMLPRGEVALIVAGVGMAQGYIDQSMFGVVIMMTLITTVIAPPALVGMFSIEKSGLKREEDAMPTFVPEFQFRVANLGQHRRSVFWDCLCRIFKAEEFAITRVGTQQKIYEFRGILGGVNTYFVARQEADAVFFDVDQEHYERIRQLTGKALVKMRDEQGQVYVEDLTSVAN
jgi:Kef-type K+ transport system membrane component KefB